MIESDVAKAESHKHPESGPVLTTDEQEMQDADKASSNESQQQSSEKQLRSEATSALRPHKESKARHKRLSGKTPKVNTIENSRQTSQEANKYNLDVMNFEDDGLNQPGAVNITATSATRRLRDVFDTSDGPDNIPNASFTRRYGADAEQRSPVVDAFLTVDRPDGPRKSDEALVLNVVADTDERRKPRILVMSIFGCLLVLGVLIGGILSAENAGTQTDRTFVSTPAPTAAGVPLDPLDVLAILGPLVGNQTNVNINTTDPSERAFYWITELDGSGIRDDPSTPEWKLKQRFALATLYYATDGENWRNQLLFLSDKDECEWFENTVYLNEGFQMFWDERVQGTALNSVLDDPFEELQDRFGVTNTTRSNNGVRTCDDEGRVTAINIPGNNLNGTLPEVLGVLKSLEYLEFLGNFVLGGTLPTSLGGLDRLRTLNLSYNSFSGSLPVEYSGMSSIKAMLLPFNFLVGSLPSEYSMWTELQIFDMSRNELVGSLPSEYSTWTDLISLDFSYSQLTGSLPTAYSSWTDLQSIYLRNNKLTGTLPTEYAEWKDLQGISFNTNQLTGTLPTEYSIWTNLRWLFFGTNDLTGTLPVEYSMWTNIEWVVFGNNAFTGSLPREYAMWRTPFRVAFDRNQLNGTLPTEYSQWTDLEWLFAGSNSLTGTLPSEYSILTDLVTIDIRNNGFTGSLPSEYSMWTNLRSFRFTSNNLTGTLPIEYSKWTFLRRMELGSNSLTGTLPEKYSTWTDLVRIRLESNGITGPLPSEYSEWTNLEWINFSSNALTGPLPIEYSAWEMLERIDFSNNMFTGTLPEGYLDWANRRDFGLNNFTIEIVTPSSVECQTANAISNSSEQVFFGEIEGSEHVFYTIPGSGQVFVADTCGDGSESSTSVDTVLAIFAGPCGPDMDIISSNNDFCGRNSLVEWFAEEGTVYYIGVSSFAGDTGAFNLRVASRP